MDNMQMPTPVSSPLAAPVSPSVHADSENELFVRPTFIQQEEQQVKAEVHDSYLDSPIGPSPKTAKPKPKKPKTKALDPIYIPGRDEDIDDEPLAPSVAKIPKKKKKPAADPSYDPRKDSDSEHDFGPVPVKVKPNRRQTLDASSFLKHESSVTPQKRKGSVADHKAGGDSKRRRVSQPLLTSTLKKELIDSGSPDRPGLPVLALPSYKRKDSKASPLYSPRRRDSEVRRKREEEKEFRLQDANDSDSDKVSAEFKISRNETDAMVFDFSRERIKRFTDAIDLPDAWHEEEKDLFLRLAMRGFEPLFPPSWQFDFGTLPESLFPGKGEDEDNTLVKVLGNSEFYASKSLNSLFTLAGRVRDCRILRKRPEVSIEREIKRYIRWAIDDAKLVFSKDSIPVYCIHTQRKGESTLNAIKRLNLHLQSLAARYSELFAANSVPFTTATDQSEASPKTPLLIGIIICGPIVAFMTHCVEPRDSDDGGKAETDSNFLSQFDLGEWGQDVWSSLVVAIAVMYIRKNMLRLADSGIGGIWRVPGGLQISGDEDL